MNNFVEGLQGGHSKSTFSQDSRVLIPLPPLFVLVRFGAPLPLRYVRFGQNPSSPHQFLYLWNLEERN